MAMKRFVTYVETTDGTVHGPFRVTFRHRDQMEKTCKARGEKPDGSFAEKILAWSSSTRTEGSPLAGQSLDDWEANIFDFTNQEMGEDEATDPTQKEASTAS